MKNLRLKHVYPVLALSGMFLLLISACKKNNDNPQPANPLLTTTVQMTGAAETPAVVTTGSGTAKITYDKDKKTITYVLNWTLGDPTSTTTDMHFHGADDGADTKSSPVVIPISGFPATSTGSLTGTTRELTPTESSQLLAGKWYVNVHSSLHPGGEIRGNIKLTDNTSTGGTGGTGGY